MSEERIVEILGLVDEKYIEEAAPAPRMVSAKKKYYSWAKWGVTAACVVGISWYGFHQFGGPKVGEEYPMSVESEESSEMIPSIVTSGIVPTVAPEVTPWAEQPIEQAVSEPTATPKLTNEQHEEKLELPMLKAEIHVGGMGFEGLMFYDISQSSSVNPWTKDAEFETLPVYKNSAYVENGPGFVICLSREEMVLKAEEVAKALGTEILSLEYEKVPRSVSEHLDRENEVYAIVAETAVGDITIEGNGAVKIDYDSAIPLPEDYNYEEVENNQEEAERIVNELLEQYSALHAFEQPVVDTWGDYSFAGDKHRWYAAFDNSKDLVTQILNYNFNKIRFYMAPYGDLSIIRYENLLECAQKIGDYPIISWETAQKLLLKGDYITTVPKEYLEDGVVKEEYIAKVELVYRTGNLEEMFMPYYSFYVELQEDNFSMAEGLKNYGVFYVPAVSGEYLTDFPVWDGRFN